MMSQIMNGNQQSFFPCRVLILESTFISKEERTKALENSIEYKEATNPKYANIDFGDNLRNINQIIYADECKNIDYGGLPNKVPITFKTHKDKVEYGTVKFAMNSTSVIDRGTTLVLE